MRSKRPFAPFHVMMLRLFTALRHGRHFRLGMPTGIGIETSAACNRRCHYCPQSWSPKKQKIISDDVWRMFVHRLKEFHWRGVTSLTFYGEPTLIADLPRKVADIAAIGAYPLLFTNGDRPEMIPHLVDAGARRIVIT